MSRHKNLQFTRSGLSAFSLSTISVLSFTSLTACGGDAPVASGQANTISDAGVSDPESATPLAAPEAAPAAPSSSAARCDPLSAAQIQQYADEITAFFAQSRARMSVLSTSISPIGTLIDWIDPKSQTANQDLAAAPPTPDLPELTDRTFTALETDLLNPLLETSSNLVPIPRMDSVAQLLQSWKCRTLADVLSKYGDANDRTTPPIEPQGAESTPDSQWAHHYATTAQLGAVYGSSAVLHVPNPYVWRDDEFSLGQVALTNKSTGTLQTIEVGWQKFADMYGDDFPHLFIYYTTNAYKQQGDDLGGYNRKVDGWVQVSKKTYPGDALILGSQLYVWVYMYNGNWWINVNNEWMGYFPGSLFAPKGLATAGDSVSWYGEILDYRLDNSSTYTQMGNGQYASAVSSYIRNIQFESINKELLFAPTNVMANKPNCYSIDVHANSGTAWGSYFFYGGPGKNSPLCL